MRRKCVHLMNSQQLHYAVVMCFVAQLLCFCDMQMRIVTLCVKAFRVTPDCHLTPCKDVMT